MNTDLDTIANEFVDSQMAGKTIPVIGDGVFVYKESETSTIPVLDYVVKRFREEYEETYPDLFSSIDPERSADLFTLTCISNKIPGQIFKSKYIRYIQDAMKDGRISMDQDVLNFLIAFEFPVIITTSCFSYPEICINKISKIKYKGIVYNRKGKNKDDLSETLNSSRIIYHLFGLAEPRFDWVYDEKVLLEFLHSLHSTDYSCENLTNYASEEKSSILILGCGLPDWLFRFLWYIIGSEYKDDRIGYWLRSDTCNPELNFFLSQIRYSPIHTIKDFLIKTTDKMNSEKSNEPEGTSIPDKFDFFISYAGEDKKIAEKLYTYLMNRGDIRVWYDKDGDGKIKCGDKYEVEFSKGIERSEHAIPIITENYLSALSDKDRGLYKELRLIKAKAKNVDTESYHFCLPLIIEDRTFLGTKITPAQLEQWARHNGIDNSPLSDLFTGTSMWTTSGDNPEIDWKK